MKIEMKITPPEPEVRTLADVPENVLCIGRNGQYYWIADGLPVTTCDHVTPSRSMHSPDRIAITEVLAPFHTVVTCTGRDTKIELVIDWPEKPSKPEPEVLTEVGEGIACLGADGSIWWWTPAGTICCEQGGCPRRSSLSPERVEITKVLGKIAFTWEPE